MLNEPAMIRPAVLMASALCRLSVVGLTRMVLVITGGCSNIETNYMNRACFGLEQNYVNF